MANIPAVKRNARCVVPNRYHFHWATAQWEWRIHDYSLAYLDNDDGKKIKIYYAGSLKKWHKIFKEYHRKSFKEAKGAEAKGGALADKLNEMIGVKYKKSHFVYYFHAHISDVK